LSIIIPAYNEESRLPGALLKISQFLELQPYSSEVLVVENGSQDGTLRMAQEFARTHASFQAMHAPGRGKGLAVQLGMLQARGEYRFMCDADLSMPIEELPRFLPPALDGAQIAIASREAPGAVRYNEPAYRHLGGRVINWMIRLLALPGFQDTQCGFKCFQAAAARDIFTRLTLLGWSFDVEALLIARRRGYRIVELPIPWYFNPDSKLNLLQDTLRMAIDLLKLRRNALVGRYDGQEV
jgi:glycosyltransferase involved in cell wall biosynthesis